uniref:Calcineurin-like phosphoesterase domain-containing protein n=1 Tax=Oryza glumipatula TaxID=40148 RepID=A0A0E0ADW1_9ORYZ
MGSSSSTSLVSLLLPCLFSLLLLRLSTHLNPDPTAAAPRFKRTPPLPLRFRHDGAFKILQVADMHFGNGAATRCRDVAPEVGGARCSDLNTTRFLRRVIEAERPDLIAFTGDNIFGGSASDAAESLLRAISPAIEYKVPWAAILGNHDQESTMTREELMVFMSLMDYSQNLHAPAFAFFHIPIPEVRGLWYTGFKGQYQEGVACSTVNSGVLDTLTSMGDVKAVFLGHDHLNDFCGDLNGIWFCYGGGFGYHAYGRPHWPRRARVIHTELKKGQKSWVEVESIHTWKLLDDEKLTKIDEQVLWRRSSIRL